MDVERRLDEIRNDSAIKKAKRIEFRSDLRCTVTMIDEVNRENEFMRTLAACLMSCVAGKEKKTHYMPDKMIPS